MATLEELVVSLVAETSGLRAELNNAAKATKDATSKMDDAIQSFSENSGKSLSFFETTMATTMGFLASQAVLGALGLVKDAVAGMYDELIKGGQAAIAEEVALKRLANSLALSGQYSEQAMSSLTNFTGAMEDQTGIADDVVASNLALLSSLTKLDSNGLQKAQKAAIDMSVALGMDLNQATTLVAKGIEGNVSAFTRYGIKVQEGANKSENLANILKTLEGSFGGAAAGAAQTFGGATKGLGNAWGNLTEELAKTITQNPVVIAMMNVLTDTLKNMTEWVKSSAIEIKQGLAAALIVATESLGALAMGLNALFGSFTDVFASAADKMAEFHHAGETAFSAITTSGDTATASIKNQKVAVDELGAARKQVLTDFVTGLQDEAAALDSNYQYQNDARAANMEVELAQLETHDTAKFDLLNANLEAQQAAMTAFHEQQWNDLEAAHAAGLGSESQYQAAKTALAQKQYLETKKIEAEVTKTKQQEEKQREQNMASTLSTISTLASSSSKELAAIGKAAAIAQATMDGYAAVQRALASAPPPWNFALAAAVGVATAANIAKIAGVGLNEGGTIAGGGANMDTVPARLTKGETVVTRDLTDKMNDFFSGNTGSGGAQSIIVELSLKDQLVEFIEAKIIERQNLNISLLPAGAS